MNQYSKEIQQDLQAMSDKYGFKRGILLFEEVDMKKPDDTRNRVILFEPGIGQKPFVPEPFAKMFVACMNVSRSFQKVLDVVSTFSFAELMHDIDVHHKLHHETDKTKN